MARGRPMPALVLSEPERGQLDALSRSRSLPKGLVDRGRIVLWSAEGMTNKEIASRLGLSARTVGKWRARYLEGGLQGLHDELRPGRPRSIEDERIATLLTTTLTRKPEGETHWSCRTMAAEAGVSKSTVHRIWRTVRLQPHRYEYFKLSTDPFFVEKVRDIVGLYLNPPTHAIVLCVDEKTQCQALERSQPILPLGLGYLEGYTHDYKRHGTTNLFAALDVARGAVITQCKARHRHEEFLQFLRHIDANVPPDLDVHIIMDNLATHKHPRVRLWLAKRPRYHVHFTPTYSSWLNQVEIWFSLISRKAIRRGSFRSTKELIKKIDEFVQKHNGSCKPFVWTATADSIFEKLGRLCETISGTDY